MSDVYAPLPYYGGELPWKIYLHIWWMNHEDIHPHITEVQRYMVESALARGDEERALKHLQDMPRSKPRCRVSKFIPGEHYHVLDRKFDTYTAALGYAEQQGYVVEGLYERHVYTRDGD